MAEKAKITPEQHKNQIEEYIKEFPHYKVYSDTLGRLLRNACKVSFPEAQIQCRPKSVSSFAEKVARKFDKYPDAVHQMTDLCGGRAIVQTADQVRAVKQFIEANFEIVEKDDKGSQLGEGQFGYRDMHYIVQLKEGRHASLGITPQEQADIGGRKAEIQVRTQSQHAWADTLHDRIYKNKLTISPEIKRTGNLLAAILEEADRMFDLLANDLDGLAANYTAFAKREEVEREIEIQEMVLANERDSGKRPGLALKLARLLAASGNHARVVALLSPHEGICDANRCELLLELGEALCRQHRDNPHSAEYARGRLLLEQSLALCQSKDVAFAPNIRKHESLHARVLTRLGWALEVFRDEERAAQDYYHKAYQHEPANPYYLANMLGFDIYRQRAEGLPQAMQTSIREAIGTCRQHALAGIELPYAYFTAGRLSLLDSSDAEALSYYARGIRHCLAGTHCVPPDALRIEVDWLKLVDNFARKVPASHQDVINLLALGIAAQGAAAPLNPKCQITPPVLIVSGGAASLDAAGVAKFRPLLTAGLADKAGTVISGGTVAGVPGCVGDVAVELDASKRSHFQLVGYIPARPSLKALAHRGYDHLVEMGDDFLLDQILANWLDILAAGIAPKDVVLLGFAGGPLSAAEYRIALALGASVGIVTGSGGTADELLKDPLWSSLPNLYPLPLDPTAVRAFLAPVESDLDPAVVEKMGMAFHEQYLAGSTRSLPVNLRPWEILDPTFRKANIEQAKYAVQILQAAGFRVLKVDRQPQPFPGFTVEDVERMAEMEHGRWNAERLRDGWRFGKPRDNERKIHNCIVPWADLPEDIREYDRIAVRGFPAILAKAGLEVSRAPAGQG